MEENSSLPAGEMSRKAATDWQTAPAQSAGLAIELIQRDGRQQGISP
jgi:hypothetical protein